MADTHHQAKRRSSSSTRAPLKKIKLEEEDPQSTYLTREKAGVGSTIDPCPTDEEKGSKGQERKCPLQKKRKESTSFLPQARHRGREKKERSKCSNFSASKEEKEGDFDNSSKKFLPDYIEGRRKKPP